MAQINLQVPAEVREKFERAVFKKYGRFHGYLSEAGVEALEEWADAVLADGILDGE